MRFWLFCLLAGNPGAGSTVLHEVKCLESLLEKRLELVLEIREKRGSFVRSRDMADPELVREASVQEFLVDLASADDEDAVDIDLVKSGEHRVDRLVDLDSFDRVYAS